MHTKPEIQEGKLPNGHLVDVLIWVEQEQESYRDVYGEDQPENSECCFVRVDVIAERDGARFTGSSSCGMICFAPDNDGRMYLESEIETIRQDAFADLALQLQTCAAGEGVQAARHRQGVAIALRSEA